MTELMLRNMTHQEVARLAFFDAATPLEKRLLQIVESLESEVYSLHQELNEHGEY